MQEVTQNGNLQYKVKNQDSYYCKILGLLVFRCLNLIKLKFACLNVPFKPTNPKLGLIVDF
jgi:hypothetical protein